MSLYLDLAIDDQMIGQIVISREFGKECQSDSINQYVWCYLVHDKKIASGCVLHRFGDGAVGLAFSALSECVNSDEYQRFLAGCCQTNDALHDRGQCVCVEEG